MHAHTSISHQREGFLWLPLLNLQLKVDSGYLPSGLTFPSRAGWVMFVCFQASRIAQQLALLKTLWKVWSWGRENGWTFHTLESVRNSLPIEGHRRPYTSFVTAQCHFPWCTPIKLSTLFKVCIIVQHFVGMCSTSLKLETADGTHTSLYNGRWDLISGKEGPHIS